MKSNSQDFSQHLERIRTAKYKADQAIEISNPGHIEAEASLAVAWECLFDLFCRDEDINVSNLNTIAGIIQKLTASYNQLKSLEIKTREHQLKEEEWLQKKQQLQQTFKSADTSNKGLTPETLKTIETQLKLL